MTDTDSPAGVNNFVVRFANVNGSGSASANRLFARTLFRMGISVTAKNIFPSNIQGLPTWYEVRVADNGCFGARGGVDIAVCTNPQSMARDIAALEGGGYCLYDSTKPLSKPLRREGVRFLGVPLMGICVREYDDPRQRQLFKNMVYVGALMELLALDFEVMKGLLEEQFAGRDKLIVANVNALELGRKHAREHFDCPLPLHVRSEGRREDGDIFLDGNTALALGALYAGATVAAWYPITPSTSVVDAFDRYARRLRIDAGDGRKKYAIVQAEDELAAIGIVVGAAWNGARAFTATSGPGLSLMGEFLGLAYFAELPAVLFDIQRAGPSTGMPTRTQQSDVLSAAYASHGDTRHVLLFPSSPAECFAFAALAFDLADELQTPVIVLSDLDLGMNDHVSPPLSWDESRRYRRGKVLGEKELEEMTERYGRYLDVDGDGVCWRTLPGAHPEKGAFFTRGTSRDPYAVYTEGGEAYRDNMQRLLRKWETAKKHVPAPEMIAGGGKNENAVICFGSSAEPVREVSGQLAARGIHLDVLCVKAFPFSAEVEEFIAAHKEVFVVEQNRDAQLRGLLVNECGADAEKLVPVLHFDGTPLTARFVRGRVLEHYGLGEARPRRESA